ncbi:WD40 repeat domain-containing protein [Microcoleus sp. LEGE 07076]|uniref:WD40 repeat domain-containing protein n=1 Tax=Microcoleus sp. LEGE 07076 TaxID=915322 RepID=UPI00187FE71E|nr:WD40 repeat domain-containing protein [Microcoleus sp. LEGE 07076]MBE9185916.1 WD40 repeat domain-containing protein [Microcoleus sp. LEGE 07076]
MGNKKTNKSEQTLEIHAKEMLSDYVTVVIWSPDGATLGVCSAAGEVMLVKVGAINELSLQPLQTATGKSTDCLSFSFDSQFVAAGGQDGKVRIWRVNSGELIANLDNQRVWVDKLAWSPNCNQLAFSMGRYVQVWNADDDIVEITLNFDSSSVLDLAWNPVVKYLAVSGYQGVKVWNGEDWDEDPHILSVPSVTNAVSWDTSGQYLACGNMDNTLIVNEWGNSEPWVMEGFPGKVRQLAWSNQNTLSGAPLLAASSSGNISVWEKQADENVGWEGLALEVHENVVNAIAFQPNTFLLASAAADGQVCLWYEAEQLLQILEGAEGGFSSLAWHPDGQFLVGGGCGGELLVWSKSMRAKGLGRL